LVNFSNLSILFADHTKDFAKIAIEGDTSDQYKLEKPDIDQSFYINEVKKAVFSPFIGRL